MAGWPNRVARSSFGPIYEDEAPVANPKREVGADVFNLEFWQLAGANLSIPIAFFILKLNGGSIDVDYQGLSWDPNNALGTLSWSVDGTGQFSLTLAASYPDEAGVLVPTNLVGAEVNVMPDSSPSVFPDGYGRIDSAVKASIFVRNVAAAYNPNIDEPMLVRLF